MSETVAVTVAAPYPAGAQPLTLTFSTAGGLQAPAQAVIAAGQASTVIQVRASAAGTAQLFASGAPYAPGQLAFTIAAPATSLNITAISPTSAPVGALVTILGTGFNAQASANIVAFFGNAPAIVQSASSTLLVAKVPDAAQSGPITVSNNLGSAESEPFTVIREQDFGLQASPAYLTVMQESNAVAVLSLPTSGTRPYQGLAKLSISGLPAGVTAKFEPATLSAYQTGKLIVQAAASAPLTTAVLTIKAEATLDGLPWVRETRVNLQVVSRAGVTGVKGRFITPSGAGISGVVIRHDATTNQQVSDAAGNFLITGLPGGVTTLRFDATPANSLYPIWPYNVTLEAGQLLTMSDWIINPPPADDKFKAINNATQDQAITDERYPGFAVTLPAGVSIVGYDGVKKTRIAVERIEPDKLPVGAPPFPMKEAYQLYFGTPMGGIPSAPIPVTLPNVADKEPGEKVEIWWFDGSPMGGTGDWKMAGLGTVSADGKQVSSDPGVGLPRFCGVCGLVSLSCPPPPKPPQPPPKCPAPSAGNPVDLFTGQEMASTGGMSCGGLTPIDTGMKYNPVDAFNNKAGTLASFGYGWTFDYDVSFLPFDGPQKRLVMPGGQLINMVDDGTGKYRPADDPRMAGMYAQNAGGKWEVVLKGGTKWQFEPFAGIPGVIRGGPPLFLTKVTDGNGNVTNVARQSNGRVQSVAGVEGRGMSMTYGSNGFVSRITDHTGRRQDYEYESGLARVNKITDAANRVTQYTYQSVKVYANSWTNGQSAHSVSACEGELPLDHRSIASIKYPESDNPTVNTISTDRILKQLTSTGQEWKFSYRRSGACVVKVLDPPESISGQGAASYREYAYTCRAGQTLSSRTCTTQNGATQCTDNVIGVCPEVESEETHAQGWRFYGGTNLETKVTKPDGQTRAYKFNARGLPTEEIDELGQSTKSSYDTKNQLAKVTDPLGRETKFEYDANGNRTATIDALGRRTETAYDAGLSKPTSFSRFLLGVPSTQGGQQLSYTPVIHTIAYDGRGNAVATTDATGIGGQMVYDGKGLLASITLPARNNTGTVPIVNAGANETISKASRKLTLSHNVAGDLASMTDSQGNETRFNTDSLGRTIGSTDPLGYSSQTQYNALDQLTQSTDALSQSTRLDYDATSRLKAVVNQANVSIERYGYDSNGRVNLVTDALNQDTRIEFGAGGRPSRVTDRKGQQTTFDYDQRGAVTRISKPGQTVDFQYDAIGRLTQVRDGSSVNSYQYDAVNRIVQADSTTAAGSHRLQYEYDSLDQVKIRTLSGSGIAQSEVTMYEWDLAGRLLSHTTTVGGQSHRTNYEYDVAGRLAARKVQAGSQADAVSQRYGWDSAERLAQIKYERADGSLIEQIDYGYDAKGQRIAKTALNNNGMGASETPMQASYDVANRLTSLTLNIQGVTKTYLLSYDANGNLTQKRNNADANDSTTFTWDANDRLNGIAQPGTSAAFTYDVFGRRLQTTVTRQGQLPATVQYLYEGAQALGEIREGQLSHRLLTGLALDETIARIAINASGQKDGGSSRIYMTDALNSVIAQLSDTATLAIQNSYGYSPYGEAQIIGPDATTNPIQYTSRESDGTGLMFYRARYYDPILKRFISEDPIGLEGGLNLFSYVNGSPVSLADPTGLKPGGAGGGAGGQSCQPDDDDDLVPPPVPAPPKPPPPPCKLIFEITTAAPPGCRYDCTPRPGYLRVTTCGVKQIPPTCTNCSTTLGSRG